MAVHQDQTDKIIKPQIEFPIYDNILNTIGSNNLESGGILGSKENTPYIISNYKFDINSRSNKNEYSPNIDFLNNIIRIWRLSGINFCGIIHSHPVGYPYLSQTDKEYALLVLNCFPNSYVMYFPLILVEEACPKIVFHALIKGNRTSEFIYNCNYEII